MNDAVPKPREARNGGILVVGAGFAGAVSARLLAEHGFQVDVVEKRPHIAGNAYDEHDENGVLVHRYGPHIFHTNSARVFEFLSRFTAWRLYEHRVLANVAGQLLPIPINKTTLSRLLGRELTEQQAADYFESVRETGRKIETSEDVVLASVGPELCDLFFRGYTRKQWGLDLAQLSPGVAARIPTRTTDDDRYFSDTYQGLPRHGYTELFSRMLDHPAIRVRLDTGFVRNMSSDFRHTIYTGPIDAYFDHAFGKLPYRSLEFVHRHFQDVESVQPVGTVNYPNTEAYTRITEFKKLTGQRHSGTSVVYEYPCETGDPYYPVPRAENEAMYQKYKAVAKETPNTTFIGRLAEYRYRNMDQVVGSAMTKVEKLIACL